MMRWWRKFFYDEDPMVRVAAGLLEPEAEMWRELLQNEGIHSFKKMDTVAVADMAAGTNVAIFVKQSDAERARGVLAPLRQQGHLVEDGSERI